MNRFPSFGGHYDNNGHWVRTKRRFMDCGQKCDCKPPFGLEYDETKDKRNMKTIQREILDDIEMGILQNGISKAIKACHENAYACGWWRNLKHDEIISDDRFKNIHLYLIESGEENLAKQFVELLPLNKDMTTEDRGIGNIFMLWVTEIAEGYEGFRKDSQDTHLPEHKMIDVEAADLFIRLCDYMGQRERESQIDFSEIIAEKLKYNMTRPDHKIENRLKEDGKKL